VVAVALKTDNCVELSDILASLEPSATGHPWKLSVCSSSAAVLRLLRKNQVPVVLCDRDDDSQSWKIMLQKISNLPAPPYIIVTSRVADEHIWSEALNLGAYDVLATPFNRGEVARVLGSAWFRWKHRKPAAAIPADPEQAVPPRVLEAIAAR
jgi:DNA-binding NtrC family response regulator